jgi:hypothetical protein
VPFLLVGRGFGAPVFLSSTRRKQTVFALTLAGGDQSRAAVLAEAMIYR